jgi:hypothetical protein
MPRHLGRVTLRIDEPLFVLGVSVFQTELAAYPVTSAELR